MGERPIAFAVVALALVVATVTDLRERRVPLWLTGSGIATGLAWAAIVQASGGSLPGVSESGSVYLDLRESGLGLLAGLLILSPFVLIGIVRGHEAVGLGDVLLLGVIGAWHGWAFVLWCTWWMSLAGGLLGLVALLRKQRSFPYVPALLLGFIAAALSQPGFGR